MASNFGPEPGLALGQTFFGEDRVAGYATGLCVTDDLVEFLERDSGSLSFSLKVGVVCTEQMNLGA